ncbi:MAG: cytochrome c, partial [Spirochaetales bacterium]|nr:cytochrome c [Spirochaetales bacterium]
IVLAIVWLPSHVPSSAQVVASANPDNGKQLYAQYCVSCHGAKGQGEFNWRSRERAAPALDSSGHAWHHEDSQLISMILDKPLPDSRMPRLRGVLGEQDAADLLAYIKTLWTPYIRENCQGAKHMSCMSMMNR